jgi:hypothetical protein
MVCPSPTPRGALETLSHIFCLIRTNPPFPKGGATPSTTHLWDQRRERLHRDARGGAIKGRVDKGVPLGDDRQVGGGARQDVALLVHKEALVFEWLGSVGWGLSCFWVVVGCRFGWVWSIGLTGDGSTQTLSSPNPNRITPLPPFAHHARVAPLRLHLRHRLLQVARALEGGKVLLGRLDGAGWVGGCD